MNCTGSYIHTHTTVARGRGLISCDTYYAHSLVLKEEDVASSASARVRLLPLDDPNNVDLVVTPVGPPRARTCMHCEKYIISVEVRTQCSYIITL